MTLCMGLIFCFASCAGLISLRSIMLTSSIISVFSSLYSSLERRVRSRISRGVSAGIWPWRDVSPTAAIGLYKASNSVTILSSWLRICAQASLQWLVASTSYVMVSSSLRWFGRGQAQAYLSEHLIDLLELGQHGGDLRVILAAGEERAHFALNPLHARDSRPIAGVEQLLGAAEGSRATGEETKLEGSRVRRTWRLWSSKLQPSQLPRGQRGSPAVAILEIRHLSVAAWCPPAALATALSPQADITCRRAARLLAESRPPNSTSPDASTRAVHLRFAPPFNMLARQHAPS